MEWIISFFCSLEIGKDIVRGVPELCRIIRHLGSGILLFVSLYHEQAAYFGLTRAQAIELGRQAKIFTANALAQPFRIHTRWRKVFGPTRYYAIVVTVGGICTLWKMRQGLRSAAGGAWFSDRPSEWDLSPISNRAVISDIRDAR